MDIDKRLKDEETVSGADSLKGKETVSEETVGAAGESAGGEEVRIIPRLTWRMRRRFSNG